MNEYDNINKRRFIRGRFPFTVHVVPVGKPPISAYTENISEVGVKVTITEELKVSSLVTLEIYLKQKPSLFTGKIVWVKKRESNYLEDQFFFDIGIEFQTISEEDKLVIKSCVAELEKEKNKYK